MAQSIEQRQKKDKEKLVSILKEIPIVQVACKRAGVSRPTYYRWRKEDARFWRDTQDALEEGYEFVNDMSESQVITLIKEKKLPAITLWLKHHHPLYGAKKKNESYQPEVELSPEQEKLLARALELTSFEIGQTNIPIYKDEEKRD